MGKAFTGGKQEMEEMEEGKEWERRALEECTRCVVVEINLRVTCLTYVLRGFKHTTITYTTATTHPPLSKGHSNGKRQGKEKERG